VQPKPTEFISEHGAWFKDPLVVSAYPFRPPYPAAAVALLRSLIVDEPRVVLDIGCGPGDLARRLARFVDRVDGIDQSPGMLELGRRLPGGDAANLRWIHASAESAAYEGPYALITAGESLHWMEWQIVMPLFSSLLTPRGVLAIVERNWDGPPAVSERFSAIARQYSAVRNYRPHALADELELRGLFRRTGERQFGPEPWRPTIEEYLQCRHSQRGFSRTHMGPEATAAFGAAVRSMLSDAIAAGDIAVHDDHLELSVSARVVYGKPLEP
jgi:SAM-dependent methyltransferase